MLSLSRALAAGALFVASVHAGDNFIITQVRTLSVTRVDPLVTPGANGPHVHNVMGASTFGPDSTTPESLENAKCTSGMVGDDKSIYWTPQVYYNMGNGSYTPMIGSTRIYYFLKALNGTTPVVAFPRGLRMLAGGPSESRPATYPPRGQLSYDQLQAMDPRIAAIKWGCAAGAVQGQGDGGYLDGQRPYLPNDAPNGCGVLNAGIFYPSCNDGRLDSPDHFSHMAYPLDGSNGYNCPASHPIKFPTMFLENFYFPTADQKYRGPGTDNFVLSNGDTLGLTMHADFINGWVPGSLENILSSCNAPNAPGDDLNACAAIAKSVSVDNADNCRSEGNIVDEDVGLLAPINALPGCNPIWPADARTKPTCKTDQLPMIQPTNRVSYPDLKIALAVAGGTSKSVAVPAAANNSYSYSYEGTATSTYSYSYTSTSAYATSSAESTSSAAAATSTDAATSSASQSTSSAAGATAAEASSSTTASASGSSEPASAASSSETGSSSSASAAPTTTSTYYDPYGYYGSSSASAATSDSTTAAASTSASTSASESTTASATESTSASASTSTSTSDAYVYPAPAAAGSSSTSTSSVSSASGSASVAAAPATTSSAAAAGAPAANPATSSVSPAASSSSAPSVHSSAYTKHMNPHKTTTGTASTSTPTPQGAHAVGNGRPPKKTCAHRKHPKRHPRRRRDWQKEMIN